jgi:predicted small secreted protein
MSKLLIGAVLVASLSACHTASGVLQGAGKDIQTVGKWVEPKPSVDIRERRQ